MDRFVKYPIAEALKPREGLCEVKDNRWWVVEDECLLFFRGFSAQCNSNKSITDRLAKGREVRFIERVFIPVDYEGNITI